MASFPPKARFSICLIEDAAHRLLFLKRGADRALGPNLWGFPAGHIEAQMKVIAAIENPAVIKRILAHLEHDPGAAQHPEQPPAPRRNSYCPA